MDVSAGFVAIGVDDDQAQVDLAALTPGRTVPIDQALFAEAGGPWQQGDEIGRAYGAFVLTRRGRLVGMLTFSFEDEDGLTASGVLPFEDSEIGDGVLAVGGGTGRLKKRTGEVHVEVRNPKRYRFDV